MSEQDERERRSKLDEQAERVARAEQTDQAAHSEQADVQSDDLSVERPRRGRPEIIPLLALESDDQLDIAEASEADDEVSDERALLSEVRRAAGWRVSPRQLEAAIEAVIDAGEEPTAERLAAVVTATRGPRSRRQSRSADLWRLLGAQLAVRGASSDPEAQAAFIGRARAIAGHEASDALALHVAIEVAANEAPLEARFVGETARWLLDQYGAELSEEEIVEGVPQAIPEVTESLASRDERPAAEGRRGPAHRQLGRREGTRGLARSGPTRWDEAPRVRRRRRAKPAGRARKPKHKRR